MSESSFGTVLVIIILITVFLFIVGGVGIALYFYFKDEKVKTPPIPPNVNPTPGNNKPLAIQSINNPDHYLYADSGSCAITHNAVQSSKPCAEMNWVFNSDGTLSPVGAPGNFLSTKKGSGGTACCTTLATRGVCLISDSSTAAKLVYNTANKTICTTGSDIVCLHVYGGGVRNIATEFAKLPSTITSDYQWQTKEALTSTAYNAICTSN